MINAGIDVYFDKYDGNLKIQHQANNPKAVTQSICNEINNSSHMLVLVSKNTINSNWVPFEIGYGYDKTDLYVLALKGIPKGSLPEYLRSSKIIRDVYDLNLKIANLKKTSLESLIESKKVSSWLDSSSPISEIMDNLISGDT